MSLDKSENEVQIDHLHPKCFHTAKISPVYPDTFDKIRQFFAVSYQNFTNEPCQLVWSYWAKVHEIFMRYRGIIYAVNAHIWGSDIPFHFGMPQW